MFTVKQLNSRITNFSLSASDANVGPASLRTSLERLLGSASQNGRFLKIIPLLSVDMAPAGADDDVSNIANMSWFQLFPLDKWLTWKLSLMIS
jgi:hypothetical protein